MPPRRTVRVGAARRRTQKLGGRLYPEKHRGVRGAPINPGYMSLYAKMDRRGVVHIDDRANDAPPDGAEAVAYATEARGKSSIVLCVIGHGHVIHRELGHDPNMRHNSALRTNGSAVNMFIPLPVTGAVMVSNNSFSDVQYDSIAHYYAELAEVYGVRDASDRDALWRNAGAAPPPNHFANLQAFLRRKFRHNTNVAESMADRFLGWVKWICDDADRDEKPLLWRIRKLTNKRGLRSRREPARGGSLRERATNNPVGRMVGRFFSRPRSKYRGIYSNMADFEAIATDDHYSGKLDLKFRKIHYNKGYTFPPENESIGINVLYCTDVKDSSGNDVGADALKSLITPVAGTHKLKSALDVDPMLFHRLFDTSSGDKQAQTLQYIVDVLSGKHNHDDGPVNVAFDNIYIYDFTCNVAYEDGVRQTAIDMRDFPMVSDELLPGDVAGTHARIDLLSRQRALKKSIIRSRARRA